MKRIKQIALLITVLASFFFAEQTFAVDWSSIKAKAAFEGIADCFGQGAFNEKWQINQGVNGFIRQPLSNETVKLPYGLTAAKKNHLNCKDVLFGFSGNNTDGLSQGLIPNAPHIFEDNTTAAKFFAGERLNGKNSYGEPSGLGYAVENSSTETETISAMNIKFTPENASACAGGFSLEYASGGVIEDRGGEKILSGAKWVTVKDNILHINTNEFN